MPRKHKERDRDDNTLYHAQSASAALALRNATGSVIPSSRGSLEVPRATPHRGTRSEAADTPQTITPEQSRRGSVLAPVLSPKDEGGTMSPTIGALLGAGFIGAGPALASARIRSTAQDREEELRQEKAKAASRASGLKQALAELNDFSNATMRRLDDSYYSVLEKVGMLQNTILGMKELAGMATETDQQFKQESEDLVKDISGQLDALGGFEDQAERIETLTTRIHNGRDKVKALGDRVEAVREKIERWERADREWQERTRRRLKTIWVFTSVLILVVVVLLIVAQYVPVGGEGTDGHYPGMGESSGRGNSTGFLAAAFNRSTHHPIDETLRVLDEL